MRLTTLVPALCTLSLTQTSHGYEFHPHSQQQATMPTKRVAIIGAGAAGASAAHHLRQFTSSAALPLNITVFERHDYIGGRSTTVHAHTDPTYPVELGASIFVQVNRILVDAARRFNLSTAGVRDAWPLPSAAGTPLLGVWDGERFVLTQAAGVEGWWDTAKLLWRYGLAPVRTRRLMRETVAKFLRMYEAPQFPWASLSDVAHEVGLTGATAATGEQYLRENGVGELFAGEVVQASTRVNYAQNLPLIHGLETMVCMATDGAMSVEGGNWQIFDRMIRSATPDVRLNTFVTAIERQDDGTYAVRSKSHSSPSSASPSLVEQTTTSDTFDTIILATPFQFANVSIHPPLAHPPDTISYVRLHVTLFASPHALSPAAFNLPPDSPVPQIVLTTLPPDEHPGSNPDGVGKPGFFSISVVKEVRNPRTGREEWVYKVFSPRRVDGAFLARILGMPPPPRASNGEGGGEKGGVGVGKEELSDEDVSWIYRKVWHSYPYLYPRVTFEEVRLERDLWYTGGMESFVSTMETSALMGMNVARLVVDRWAKEKEGSEQERVWEGKGEEWQKPLKAKL